MEELRKREGLWMHRTFSVLLLRTVLYLFRKSSLFRIEIQIRSLLLLSLQDNQFLGAPGQVFKSVFPDHYHIFNPYPESFFQINAGFHGYHNSRYKPVVADLVKAGIFMNLHTYAVAQAV